MEEKIKDVTPPPTLEGALEINNKLIYECLCTADRLYRELTSDSYLKDDTECQPTCIMADIMRQNDNLSLLNKILKNINTNIILGGN